MSDFSIIVALLLFCVFGVVWQEYRLKYLKTAEAIAKFTEKERRNATVFLYITIILGVFLFVVLSVRIIPEI